jgi:uncharacterized protein DUF3311
MRLARDTRDCSSSGGTSMSTRFCMPLLSRAQCFSKLRGFSPMAKTQGQYQMRIDRGHLLESEKSCHNCAKRLTSGLHVKRPSLGAILLGLIPFAATCFSVALWDRVYPMVLGLPFNFFWLILWLLLTPLCMWGAYRLEVPPAPKPPRRGEGGAD